MFICVVLWEFLSKYCGNRCQACAWALPMEGNGAAGVVFWRAWMSSLADVSAASAEEVRGIGQSCRKNLTFSSTMVDAVEFTYTF